MANNFVSNPIKIDTVFSASTNLNGGAEITLDEIYWFNPTNISDTFSVTLGDGTQVLRTGRCEVANQSQLYSGYGRRVTAIQVPTLASGTLYIYWH
jgi:hypothetical protein